MKCLVCKNENIKSEHVYCGICGTKIKKDEPSANEFDHKKINLFKLYHEAGGTGSMEKLEELASQLLDACVEKKSSVMVVFTDDLSDGGDTSIMVAGNRNTLVMQLLSLADKLADNCDCPNCIARRAAEQEHQGNTADDEEVFSMLAKMLKGENNG